MVQLNQGFVSARRLLKDSKTVSKLENNHRKKFRRGILIPRNLILQSTVDFDNYNLLYK